MDKEQVVEKVRVFSDVVRKHFEVEKVILFGSYAKGTAGANSDVDVAVILKCFPEDWLAASAKLFKLTRDIDIRIEPVILGEADEKSGFLEEVQRTGQIFYQRSA